jgi:hypothetical protein
MVLYVEWKEWNGMDRQRVWTTCGRVGYGRLDVDRSTTDRKTDSCAILDIRTGGRTLGYVPWYWYRYGYMVPGTEATYLLSTTTVQ